MVQKKLSIAFVWHMHQPVYQESRNDYFLMPWVRLHAVKDYLDMLTVMDNYKKLKLNFSLVPILLTALDNYGNKGFHDLHSKLTVTPVEDLTDDDKLFIINNFFDANYANMILPRIRYADLYKKRYSSDEVDINDFSDDEYSDIMALFNLVWFETELQRSHPEIKALLEKEAHYTLEDRIRILELHREIIRQIIPLYKKYQDENKIEILANAYFHPVLPILLDKKYTGADMRDDAYSQLKLGLDRYKEVFGRDAKGIWPSEQCVSPKTLDLFAEMGIKWTLADEGILAKTINKEFVRDFNGYLEDPYDLTVAYQYEGKNKNPISIIFRDSVIPNLINFEYSQHNSVESANDLYDRIKTIQSKLVQSPDKENLLTIALDGENCWESYPDDGEIFVKTLYDLIENDKTLETVLVSEYLEKVETKKTLKTIHTGSWINRNLKLWIDEPTKDLAWQYVIKTREDLLRYSQECKDESIVKQAWDELYIAQGSDWFWWYGEPNDSGQDEIFDYLFRVHLINIYNFFNKPIPDYLNVPLSVHLGKPLRTPRSNITPIINGVIMQKDNWKNAGCIEIPDGPNLQNNKPIDRIYFGCDKDNLYIRFDMNKAYIESKYEGAFDYLNHFQAYIYLKNERLAHKVGANIRTITKLETTYPTLLDKYTHEIMILAMQGKMAPIVMAKANKNGLWSLKLVNKIKMAFVDIMEIAIPFDELQIKSGECLEFFIVHSLLDVVNDFYPKDTLLSVVRP